MKFFVSIGVLFTSRYWEIIIVYTKTAMGYSRSWIYSQKM